MRALGELAPLAAVGIVGLPKPIYLYYPNTGPSWCDPPQLSRGAALTIALDPDRPVNIANVQTDWIGPHWGRAAHNSPSKRLSRLTTPQPDELKEKTLGKLMKCKH
ncbi:hypothetical protein FH972_016107 [Carpinus fangiana]|uniref:Uncharacterized protein n=1 Tax=Carpinus fangiana TaxID=176857 RepID=A0A5N6RIE2_9ROSI|nr:hypothetical protein FH972_016107 [Carpinus fangiana]